MEKVMAILFAAVDTSQPTLFWDKKVWSVVLAMLSQVSEVKVGVKFLNAAFPVRQWKNVTKSLLDELIDVFVELIGKSTS